MTLARVANESINKFEIGTKVYNSTEEIGTVVGYKEKLFCERWVTHVVVEYAGGFQNEILPENLTMEIVDEPSLDDRKRACVENLIESGLFTDDTATAFVETMPTRAIIDNSDTHMRLKALR